VHPHGVHVLDGADDHHVVHVVTHDFQFKFLPPKNGLFEHDSMNEARIETLAGKIEQFFPVVGDSASGAPQGERGTDDDGKPDFSGDALHLRKGPRNSTSGHFQPDLFHGVTKELPVFSLLDDIGLGPDHFDSIAVENPRFGNSYGHVESGLTSESRKQSIWALPGDNLFHRLRGDRLNVGAVCRLGIGHDGGRIAVDQNDLVAFFTESFAGLCS